MYVYVTGKLTGFKLTQCSYVYVTGNLTVLAVPPTLKSAARNVFKETLQNKYRENRLFAVVGMDVFKQMLLLPIVPENRLFAVVGTYSLPAVFSPFLLCHRH
jgi:hypothetical protein